MLGPATLERYARKALEEVGDASLGEWVEITGRAVHVRRRLSDEEAASVGPVVDIRSDGPEVERRLRPVRRWLPPNWSE